MTKLSSIYYNKFFFKIFIIKKNFKIITQKYY